MPGPFKKGGRMPKDYLALDTNFPSFTGTETTDQKVDQLYNYTYMLLENLRYTLRNLDSSNFNEAGLNEITDPIYAKIEDAEGNITQLQIEAQGLALRVSNAEGDITQLGVTAQGLAAQISNAEGDITTLQATAAGLDTRVTSAEGNITNLQLTANGLSLTVGQQGSAIQSLQFTINGLTITGPTGTTMINGGAIYTPTLMVQDLYGYTVNLRNSSGGIMGGIGITGAVSAGAAIDITSFGALRMTANSGDAYIQGNTVALSSTQGTVSCRGAFIPTSSGGYSLGTYGFVWSTAYLGSDPVVTSDREEKNSISYDLEKYRGLFMSLKPCSFRYNSQEPERTQLGFVVQDVEEELTDNQLGYNDFAGIVIDRKGGKEYRGLRANHITALNTWMIQELLRRVEALEGGRT